MSICFHHLALAQAKDSVRIELERAELVGGLKSLEDSISLSIVALDAPRPPQKNEKALALQRKNRNELVEHHSRLVLDITEIEHTSQNAWSEKAVARVRQNKNEIRRQYHRICPTMNPSDPKPIHQP